MRDDYLSADWAKHHHALTNGLYNLMALLSFGLLKTAKKAAAPRACQSPCG